jgi:hypothetical protein
MNNSTTVVIAAVVFALIGTMVFAAIAPNISEVKAAGHKGHGLPGACDNSNGQAPDTNKHCPP